MDCSLPGSSVLGVLQTKIMRVNPRLCDCVLGLRGDTRVVEAFGVASVEMIPKSRAPGWLLTAAAGGSARRPYSLLRPRPMEAERGCGWPGCPISAVLAADSVPEVGVHRGLAFLLSHSLLFTLGAALALLLLSTPESASLCLGTVILRPPKLPRQRACGAGCIRAPRTILSKLNEERHRRLCWAFPI